MSINYLKKAAKTPETDEAQTREIVVNMLDDIKANGEEAVRKYAQKLDNWTGDFIVTQKDIDKAAASLDQRTRDDIQFAHEQVYNFAKKQRESMLEFETELHPGVIAGQKLIHLFLGKPYVSAFKPDRYLVTKFDFDQDAVREHPSDHRGPAPADRRRGQRTDWSGRPSECTCHPAGSSRPRYRGRTTDLPATSRSRRPAGVELFRSGGRWPNRC